MMNSTAQGTPQDSLLKVPVVTLYFWASKLVITAMGEAASDFLVSHANPYLAVLGCGILFVVALLLQIRKSHYHPVYYWFAVIMVSIFGTQIADVAHVVAGIPYRLTTAGFLVALAAVIMVWKLSEKTLAIHSVHSTRREIFYWTTVVTTFSLGTAAGDMTASSLGLGFLSSGLLFLALFTVAILAYLMTDAWEVAGFWIAYILTRPLGASFADWLDKPVPSGGLGLGTTAVSGTLAATVLLVLLFLQISGVDDPNREKSPA